MFRIYMLVFGILLTSCNQNELQHHSLIGYINPSNSFGPTDFKTCSDQVTLDYGYGYSTRDERPGYQGGGNEIKRLAINAYDRRLYSDSGFLTFRFVVNCHGEAGRFVIEEVDLNFNEHSFDKKLKKDLLNFVSQLDRWNPVCFGADYVDAYMFITFKLEDGQIIEVLP